MKFINDLLILTPTQARIVYALSENTMVTGSRICKLAKVPRGSVYNHLLRLREMDYIKQQDTVYSLTELGFAVVSAINKFKEEREDVIREKRPSISLQPTHRAA